MRDFAGRENLDWDMLRAVRRQWRGHLVLKGVVHPADARQARDCGVDAIVVSNHGGRQLDGTAAPLWVLPQVVDAVGDLPVLVDSGFRRGTDVLKAIALGARCVFVGRPFNYAQAVGGPAGIAHAIGLLKAEIRADMGLLGVNTLAELGRDRLLLPPELRAGGDALRPAQG
jgi:L-lactate dehydrogenase (cytochrome)